MSRKSILNHFSRIHLIILLIVLVGLVVISHPVTAQEELSFVYGTNHFNGAIFNSTFIPPEMDTFYLIADHTSIVASRFTRVYYWPLTDELKPDWDEANIIVEGQLEILKNDAVVEEIDLTNYVIQYDAADRLGTTQLYLGEDAVAARQNFEELQAQYREDLFQYFDEMNGYREAFQAALAELQAGNITEDQMPEPPEPQEDLSLFSTDLLVGFPINLPEGTYRVQLRLPDGSIQSDSQKRLVVFSPIQEGIGYKVFTQERWTAPEESKEVNEIIYGLPGKTLYLEPFYQVEFNELFYTRMNDPQDTLARRDRNVWVPFEDVREASLQLNSARGTEKTELENYFVRQLAGSTLGYEILVHDPAGDREITFSGFEIEINASEIHIQLLDSQGNPLQYSQREVRVLRADQSNWIFVLSSLPLIAGVVAVLLRRRSVNSGKTNEQEF